jgi:hypothetical protein
MSERREAWLSYAKGRLRHTCLCNLNNSVTDAAAAGNSATTQRLAVCTANKSAALTIAADPSASACPSIL